MRNSLLRLAIIFFPMAVFCQNYTGYTKYGSNCLAAGLEYSYWLRDIKGSSFKRIDGTFLTHKITYKFRNTFNKKICFTYEMHLDGKKLDYGRGCIKPNSESTLAAWVYLESARVPDLLIKGVRFRENNSYKELKVACDERKNEFYYIESSNPSISNSSSNKVFTTDDGSLIYQGGHRDFSNKNKPNLSSSDDKFSNTNKYEERKRLMNLGNQYVKARQDEKALDYYQRAQQIEYNEGTDIAVRGLQKKLQNRKEQSTYQNNMNSTNNNQNSIARSKRQELEVAIGESTKSSDKSFRTVEKFNNKNENQDENIKSIFKEILDLISYCYYIGVL